MKSALIGVAFIAAASLAGPVFAQEAIEEPGYCAQFYPNANCQNYGPGNPYSGRYRQRSGWYGSHARMMRQQYRHHVHTRMH